jgi:hypothetical protein
MKQANGDSSVHLTECGLPGIGPVPYGLHLCHFFPQRQDLADGLLAYFKAGIRNNESCLWVAADPLPAAEAREEAGKVPELADALASGQLKIFDAREWYGEAGSYLPAKLTQAWIEAEQTALAAGHNGLRVSGNTSFLQASDWDAFMAYEHALSPILERRRILTLCSYSLGRCRPTDMLDVVRHHHVTIDRVDTGWQVQRDVLALPRAGVTPKAS